MSGIRRRAEGRSENELRFRKTLGEGARLLQAGRPSEALPHLEEAFELGPDDPDAAINLGGAHILLNQHQKAIPILEAACAAVPDNSKIWINLGAAYLGNPVLATSEKQLRAIAAFEQALNVDPLAPSVNYNLGLIHRDRGEVEAAMAHFRRAISVNPLDRDAHRLLASLQTLASSDVEPKPSPDGGADGR